MNEGQSLIDNDSENSSRTLFKPATWLAAIDFINNLILFNNVLITVLSEKKGGKTSFSTLLQNTLDKQIKPISLIIQPLSDKEHIISEIAAQLDLSYDTETNISSLSSQINDRKTHVLLILDDAHHLPESLINEIMCAIKSRDDCGYLHFCLVSDYSIVPTLNHLAVDSFTNLIHTIELGALNENETRVYVLQRAMAARLINKPLSSAELTHFHQLTNGNVAKINNELESFILNSTTQKTDNKMVLFRKITLGVTVLVLSGLSYLFIDGSYNTRQFPHMDNSTKPLPVEQVIGTLKEAVNESLPGPGELDSKIASWLDLSTVQLVKSTVPEKQISDDISDEEQHSHLVAIADKALFIPTATKSDLYEIKRPEILESKLRPLLNPHLLVSKNKKLPVQNEINSDNFYTIQLIASKNMNQVIQFKKSNKLFANTTIRSITNAKGHWYILTLGEYKSKTQVQTQVKKLPSQLAQLNPWIRPMTGLSDLG